MLWGLTPAPLPPSFLFFRPSFLSFFLNFSFKIEEMYSSADNIQLDMSALAATAPQADGSTSVAPTLSERLWIVPPRTSKPIIVVVVNSPEVGVVQVRGGGEKSISIAHSPSFLTPIYPRTHRDMLTFAPTTASPTLLSPWRWTWSTVSLGWL